MRYEENMWFSPAFVLSQIRSTRAAVSPEVFETSSRYLRLRELRAALVPAASIHMQTGDCIFVQSGKRSDDPPDVRILHVPAAVLQRLPYRAEKDVVQINNVEVTTYTAGRKTTDETLQEQLMRTKWRHGYDFKGIILVESDTMPDSYDDLQVPDISQALWIVVNDKRRTKSGAFFISMHPDRRKIQINVGAVAANMRRLHSPDVLMLSNYGVRHLDVSAWNTSTV